MRNCLWLNLGNDTEARKHGHKQIENYICNFITYDPSQSPKEYIHVFLPIGIYVYI